MLATHAAPLLMVTQHGARIARWDLLKPITALARYVARWSKACDAALRRLRCYVWSTLDWALYGYVGDGARKLKLAILRRCRLRWRWRNG